ncbi:MAG: quinol dehydrogenase membrane component [Euryarchaeota archaeon ADurb.BinA087]|nr:MAG: quinol dehydrogenase membrane component [Euryarchaeota archaeon ADurb.BinA087]
MVFEQARALGFIYALVMFFILAYLWYTKRWTRRIGWIILLITVALGFLIFSPIIPWQFQSLVLRDARGVGGPLTVAAAGLIVMLVLSFVFGRFYCGYLCPVGAVQELASLAPVSKVKVGSKVWPGAIRWIFFILFIIAGYFFTYGLLRLFGIRDFFLLLLSAGFIIFLAIIAISLFLYRPFCRFICPFGALASVPAMGSRFKIRRTDACISCGKCERACPTNEAKRDDRKGECYLCHRCLDVCPVEGALEYRRAGGELGKEGAK